MTISLRKSLLNPSAVEVNYTDSGLQGKESSKTRDERLLATQ